MILAPIVFLQVPLRSSFADLPSRGNLTIIGAATRPHASPENFAQELTHSTRLHVPPGSFTRLHAPSCTPTRIHALSRARFLLLTSALGDAITATSLLMSLPRHLLMSLLTRTLTRPLTLIVDFDR